MDNRAFRTAAISTPITASMLYDLVNCPQRVSRTALVKIDANGAHLSLDAKRAAQALAARIRRRGVGKEEGRAMNKFSKELVESMTEACEHAEGKPGRVRVHVVDVRAGYFPR
jgi:hypothetical protein